MKKNGFTLIELLAVIVILAIIALIATPIILGIINDAREESNKRSVELYASAVKNGIAAYQLSGKEVEAKTYKSSELTFVEYDGNIVCDTVVIYADGKIYVADCTVNGNYVEYEYGTKQVLQYKPQYYSWSSGNIGGDLPDDARLTVSELNPSYSFYLGFDVDSNKKVIAAYVCFTRNDTEYCLKGYDTDAYETNKIVLEEAIKDAKDRCTFDEKFNDYLVSYCHSYGLQAHGNGLVHKNDGPLNDDAANCYVKSTGYFECALPF